MSFVIRIWIGQTAQIYRTKRTNWLLAQPFLVQVSKFENPQDACAAIVAESYRLWLQYETRTDDITIIIVHIDGFEEVSTCKKQRRLE